MAIIAKRKEYEIEANTTTLEVNVKSWYSSQVEPDYQYNIPKTSDYAGVPQDLVVDVSPFIGSEPGYMFKMEPQPIPTNITPILESEWLNVKLEVNGVEETHTAVNGYVAPIDESFYDNRDVTKVIHANTQSQLSLPPGNYTVTWTTSDGQVQFETVSSTIPVTARVANTGLDLTTAKTLVIDTGFYQYKYEIVCGYQNTTIGFVNKTGMWEYFDVLGRRDDTMNRTASTYTQYSTREKRDVNVNGYYTYRFNTGWVNKSFYEILDQFMMSENTIWIDENGEPQRIIMNTNSMRHQTRLNDKMMNYNFNCEIAGAII